MQCRFYRTVGYEIWQKLSYSKRLKKKRIFHRNFEFGRWNCTLLGKNRIADLDSNLNLFRDEVDIFRDCDIFCSKLEFQTQMDFMITTCLGKVSEEGLFLTGPGNEKTINKPVRGSLRWRILWNTSSEWIVGILFIWGEVIRSERKPFCREVFP